MPDAKRVVVTGATGLIGKRICARLAEKGYAVVVFARDVAAARPSHTTGGRICQVHGQRKRRMVLAIDGAFGVINLAGANNFGRRWSEAYKREIHDSRVVGTRGLVNAMRAAAEKPRVFVSGSAVGIYGFRYDTPLDETASYGDDFLVNVVKDWEAEANKAEELGIRTVLFRSGVVLGGEQPGLPWPFDFRGLSPSRPGFVLDLKNGALPLMALPYRFFIGGPIGSGKNWFPWIHLDDEVELLILTLEDEQLSGPLTATAPEPLTNRDFSHALGLVLGRPAWFPLPGFGLKAAARRGRRYAGPGPARSAGQSPGSRLPLSLSNCRIGPAPARQRLAEFCRLHRRINRSTARFSGVRIRWMPTFV